jgi:hypothetical protein
MSRQACTRDVWIGLVTVACGLAYLYATPLQVSPDADGEAGVSGRTLPYLAGALMILLGVALSLTSWARARVTPRDGSAPAVLAGLGRVLVYVGLIAGYALGIAIVGYVVSTACALLAAMVFSGARGWLTLALVTAITPAVLFGVFHLVMKIPLPQAWLF